MPRLVRCMNWILIPILMLYKPVSSLTCLGCDSITQPRHCHTVARCETGEVCGTERLESSSGHVTYRLSCVKQRWCPSGNVSQNASSCVECCSTDLCNAGVCGQPDYPEDRGPVCYDCRDDIHLCNNIDICSVNEVCSVIGRKEFGDSIWTMGCKQRHSCTTTIVDPSTVIGRRSAPVKRSGSYVLCEKCCSEDLCNSNCTGDPCRSSPCAHGTCSSSNDGTYQCHCLQGWTGKTCSDMTSTSTMAYVTSYTTSAHQTPLHKPYDCLDILQRNSRQSLPDGVYQIRLKDTGKDISVYCDMTRDGGGWTVFQKRYNGRLDFYRNFSEFENGFGSVFGEHWLGLKYVFELTNGVYNELRLDLESSTGSQRYEVFQNFSISPTPKYTLHIGSGNGTAGEQSLQYQNNQPFFTYDNEQGGLSGKICPNMCHGGWWFNYCAQANLNGVYVTPGTVASSYDSGQGGMIYQSWLGKKSLKATEMKFRRK